MQAAHPFPAFPTKIISVKGSDREIGRQHAAQVGEHISLGMPAFYYRFWRAALTGQMNGSSGNPLRSAVGYLLDPLLVDRLLKKVPSFVSERIEGMVDVAGISAREYVTALVLPDLLPMLQAYAGKMGLARFIEANPPRFGCSSFVAKGKSFLHGRNLDFPGVAYWDRYPVIQLTERKGYLKYIGFTTAGVPIAGITGVNEEKISVSLHQHYCTKTFLGGQLPFITGEEILGRARSLKEAKEIISGMEVSSSWAFIVCDGKTGEAFICESHPGVKDFRTFSNAPMAHSNYFQAAACRPAEYATTARMNWDNYWRKTRLENLVKDAGSFSAKDGTKFVSDHFDSYWGEEKPINRTVSQVYNIQSLVMDLEGMKVWMAEGNAPVHLRGYREYDLGAIFSGNLKAGSNTTEGYDFKSEKNRLAKESYILSFIAAFDGDYSTAKMRVAESMNHAFWPETGLVSAILAMKDEDFEKARGLIEKSRAFIEAKKSEKRLKQFPPEYFEICFWQARILDLLGKRTEALREYAFVAGHPDLEDVNIRHKAGKPGTYQSKRLKKILMPYSSYIPFD